MGSGEDDGSAAACSWLLAFAAQRNVLEVLHVHVADLMGGVLHGEHVVVAGVGIDPIAGRDDAVGGERGDDVVDHVFRREADERGALAIDVELQAGIFKVLGDVDVADAGEAAKLLRDVLALAKAAG